MPTAVTSVVIGSARNVAWWHFPIFFYSSTWVGLHLGVLRKKAGKMCLQPYRFRGGFTRDSRGYGQKIGSKSKIFQGPQ